MSLGSFRWGPRTAQELKPVGRIHRQNPAPLCPSRASLRGRHQQPSSAKQSTQFICNAAEIKGVNTVALFRWDVQFIVLKFDWNSAGPLATQEPKAPASTKITVPLPTLDPYFVVHAQVQLSLLLCLKLHLNML